MSVTHILVDGSWRASQSGATFQAMNPKTMQPLPGQFPISTWADLEPMLAAASKAFEQLRALPDEQRALFLESYATLIEKNKSQLAELATLETGLPVEPRLVVNEIPRTVDQLRQAAQSVRRNDWQLATHDAQRNIHSCYIPLGPVLVIGPNNFPFAYNSVSGGDFASAIAAGCPVIAKGHPAHPGTTQKLAELAQQAASDANLPPGTVQMFFHLEPSDGLKLVADHRITSVGFTGSRSTGLALKKVADEHGKPIFLEMGSLNPVVLLPGALEERFDALLEEVTGSCLLGMGQFCTNPGLLFFIEGPKAQAFIDGMKTKYQTAAVGTLLTQGVRDNLHASVQALRESGALLLTGGQPGGGAGFSYQHTLMQTTGSHFLKLAEALQREAFGNATLAIVCKNIDELKSALQQLEGQLVGSIYSDTTGKDNQQYDLLSPVLRNKVGRLLNDRMPTGVMVSPAMNHGGPYPATGHPHFTAVGFPASIRRFCMLACYDNVRPERLPEVLRKGLSS
ncbi:MAG: aldehyde dehydrogenase (NADP(+)) [Planctomycetia bacterium]|nr:aldehyde dehydrogenase (NADP(+)) [Planctomycetia bacterium]